MAFGCLAAVAAWSPAAAQNNAALAAQLSNPVADLISIPFQFNFDENFGLDDSGSRTLLNIQPVFPFSLNSDWNLISRTIVPLVWSDDIPSGAGSEFGMGDIVQSFFFSPKQPTAGGLIWGVGPAFLLPTATEPQFGTEKWGVGVTGVALVQAGPWTYGGLANHIVSVAGASDRADVNATYLQPFVVFGKQNGVSYALNSESTYDWENDQWTVPINALVFRVLPIGGRPVSLQAGVRYWAEAPAGGPEGFGLRLSATLLFPK
jgi:hypothetical protein